MNPFGRVGWKAESLHECPSVWRAFLNFVKNHRHDHKDLREPLTDKAEKILRKLEGEVHAQMQKHLDVVIEPLVGHWSLRDHLQQRFQNDLQHPEPGTLYMLWDHTDTSGHC